MEYILITVALVNVVWIAIIGFRVSKELGKMTGERNELERENARLSGVVERMRKEEKQRKIDMEF